MTDSATDCRLSLHEKVSLLTAYFQDSKPGYRESIQVFRPGTKTAVTFKAGKALSSLLPYFLGNAKGRMKGLSPSLRTQLAALHWFMPWLDRLATQRAAGPASAIPDLEEQTRLLVQAFPTAKPRVGEVASIRRGNGLFFELDGGRLLKKLSANFFGCATRHNRIDGEHKKLLESLPWFSAWLAEGRRRRRTAALRTVFTVQAKIDLLCRHYTARPDGSPGGRPSWKDVIPQRVPAELGGGTWSFRPAWFLDDLSPAFCDGAKVAVALSESQRAQLEALPWAREWVQDMRTNYAKKLKKRARARASVGA
tara:strand:+ start:72 stop:998 length:927 start_codon:yes stop_codon:yes gene_type:complete